MAKPLLPPKFKPTMHYGEVVSISVLKKCKIVNIANYFLTINWRVQKNIIIWKREGCVYTDKTGVKFDKCNDISLLKICEKLLLIETMHAKSEKYEFCSFLVFEKLRSTVKFGVSTALKNDKDKDKYKDKNRASNT